MAKYLLLRGWLVFLKTSVRCGLPIFLKVNHQLESRMQEICQSGSEGGAKLTFVPTPISAQALAWVALFLRASPVRAPDNAGAIHIDRTQIQMTISSAPSGLVAFIVTPPRLKPGLGSQGPSGGNRLQSPTRSWAKLPWPFRPPSCTQPYPLNQI